VDSSRATSFEKVNNESESTVSQNDSLTARKTDENQNNKFLEVVSSEDVSGGKTKQEGCQSILEKNEVKMDTSENSADKHHDGNSSKMANTNSLDNSLQRQFQSFQVDEDEKRSQKSPLLPALNPQEAKTVNPVKSEERALTTKDLFQIVTVKKELNDLEDNDCTASTEKLHKSDSLPPVQHSLLNVKTSPCEEKTLLPSFSPLIKTSSSFSRCRLCFLSFPTQIERDQHEHYLCRAGAGGILSMTGAHDNNFLLRTADGERFATEDDEESLRCYRVRSMIAGEKQQTLKAYYQHNSRPTGSDLDRLAARVAFPKRVVQVWFQNMRARDRRKGKSIPDGRSVAGRAFSPDIGLLSHVSASSCLSIPIFSDKNNHRRAAYEELGFCASPENRRKRVLSSGGYSRVNPRNNLKESSRIDVADADKPLDLSLKVFNPPVAHSRVPVAPAQNQFVGAALDLSIRSTQSDVSTIYYKPEDFPSTAEDRTPPPCDINSWQFESRRGGSDTSSSPSASSLRSLTAVSNVINDRVNVGVVSSPDVAGGFTAGRLVALGYNSAGVKRVRHTRRRLLRQVDFFINILSDEIYLKSA